MYLIVILCYKNKDNLNCYCYFELNILRRKFSTKTIYARISIWPNDYLCLVILPQKCCQYLIHQKDMNEHNNCFSCT